MQQKHAIIIGSGIAGLAIATRLAVLGFRVSVYEKNPGPGGKAGQLLIDGFTFDTGPSLFTQPCDVEELFSFAGEDIAKYLRYKKVPLASKYFFENGAVINASSDPETFTAELENKGFESRVKVLSYLSKAAKMYRDIGEVVLNYSLHKTSTWFHPRLLKAIAATRISQVVGTMNDYNQKNFMSAEARQIFNRFATYNGSNPYTAPAMLSMISHLEHNGGVYYPEGGMYSITNALYRLAVEKGVEFNFNQPVERIIYHEGIARGVVVKGVNTSCDLVISNADVYFTFKNLVGHNTKAAKVIKSERSSSAIVFYWGINRIFPSLDLHNIFFSTHYKEEFDCIFKKKTVSEDPTVYINITSKIEPGHAPENKENWFVMVNVPANHGQDWDAIQQQVRVNVISKLSRMLDTDIEACIECEEIVNPVILEQQTGCYQGAIYGGSSNSKWASFSRPPNFTSYISNLYFCGGTVHPGGGIPLCLKSAKITAALVKEKFKEKAH